MPLWEPGQTAYVCGSAGFAEAASQLLVDLGCPPSSVRVERFGPSGPRLPDRAVVEPSAGGAASLRFGQRRDALGETAMADDSDLRRDLLWRIEARRGSTRPPPAHRPRTRRRATITVVLSSLAALFTAGPALVGEPFAQSVQDSLGLASDSYAWRTLCLLALLVSVAAAVLTNLGKAQDDVARLSSAEAANTELEGRSGLMQFGHRRWRTASSSTSSTS